ncbi:MAG: hypothetical protein RLZZ500_1163 [Bacteroidota bacterium]|jgi:tetratricopeptide (TPR) repeat protein
MPSFNKTHFFLHFLLFSLLFNFCIGQELDKKIELQRSIQELTHAIEKENTYDNYFLRGSYYFTLGNLNEAENDMQTSLEINPNADEPLLYLGMIASKKFLYKKAIDYFNSFIERKPDSFIGHENRGFVFLQIDNFNKAEEDINFCLERKPKNINALIYKGILLLKTNNAKVAISYFEEVLTIEKNNLLALENRAFCKSALGQNALNDFDLLCSLAPSNGQYFYNRAIYIINTKSKRDYCNDLKKAISLGFEEAKSILNSNCK